MPSILTETTSPVSTALTTLAKAKEELGITDTASDALITKLIDRASSVIASYCDRVFGYAVLSELFRYAPITGFARANWRTLRLSRWPLVSLTSVTDGDGLVSPTLYESETGPTFSFVHRILNSERSFWTQPPFTVVYTAGWNLPNDTSPNLPSDVEEVCLSMVRSAWYRRQGDPSVQIDLVEGVGRTTYFQRGLSGMDLDDGQMDILRPYVNQPV